MKKIIFILVFLLVICLSSNANAGCGIYGAGKSCGDYQGSYQGGISPQDQSWIKELKTCECRTCPQNSYKCGLKNILDNQIQKNTVSCCSLNIFGGIQPCCCNKGFKPDANGECVKEGEETKEIKKTLKCCKDSLFSGCDTNAYWKDTNDCGFLKSCSNCKVLDCENACNKLGYRGRTDGEGNCLCYQSNDVTLGLFLECTSSEQCPFNQFCVKVKDKTSGICRDKIENEKPCEKTIENNNDLSCKGGECADGICKEKEYALGECRPDCTQGDNVCHIECEGKNECFYISKECDKQRINTNFKTTISDSCIDITAWVDWKENGKFENSNEVELKCLLGSDYEGYYCAIDKLPRKTCSEGCADEAYCKNCLHCKDGIKNCDEIDVDFGGADCPTTKDGRTEYNCYRNTETNEYRCASVDFASQFDTPARRKIGTDKPNLYQTVSGPYKFENCEGLCSTKIEAWYCCAGLKETKCVPGANEEDVKEKYCSDGKITGGPYYLESCKVDCMQICDLSLFSGIYPDDYYDIDEIKNNEDLTPISGEGDMPTGCDVLLLSYLAKNDETSEITFNKAVKLFCENAKQIVVTIGPEVTPAGSEGQTSTTGPSEKIVYENEIAQDLCKK